jgi:hypothetical protein
MPKRYKEFPLKGISEGHQAHANDQRMPRVEEIKNMYISQSDQVPTLKYVYLSI